MSTAVWYVFLLVPVIAIAYVMWAYRKRAADKEARSRERMVALTGVPPGAGPARREPAAPPVAAQPAAAAPQIARPGRFLTQPETVLFYLLKAGLSGHEVFPRVGVAAVLGGRDNAAGPAYESGPRPALDFVVCDKDMRVIAAILLVGQAARQDAESLSQALASAGIRLVTVDAVALPRREQVRALIYGL